jgi:hypothetical protein
MRKPRKRIEIQALKNMVNCCLAYVTETKEFRKGMISILERVLHYTGYKAEYILLSELEVLKGEKPGIYRLREPDKHLAGTDPTRRRYI